jgi:hypothetical protein
MDRGATNNRRRFPSRCRSLDGDVGVLLTKRILTTTTKRLSMRGHRPHPKMSSPKHSTSGNPPQPSFVTALPPCFGVAKGQPPVSKRRRTCYVCSPCTSVFPDTTPEISHIPGMVTLVEPVRLTISCSFQSPLPAAAPLAHVSPECRDELRSDLPPAQPSKQSLGI